MILTQESIERFLSSLSVKGKSHNTVRAYRADLTGLLATLQPAEDYPLLEESAGSYLTAYRMEWAPATTARKLAAFRAYGSFMGDPTFLAEYTPPSVAPGVAHPLPGGMQTVNEMIESATRPAHVALLVLCGKLGLRVTEARSIRPKDFEYKSDGIFLRVRGKGDKTRVVPVPDSATALLAPILLRTPPSEVIVPLSDRAARAKINRLGAASHDLRMTVGTAFYDETGDLRATQELLGHASSSTTEGYTAVKAKTIRAGLEGL